MEVKSLVKIVRISLDLLRHLAVGSFIVKSAALLFVKKMITTN